MSFVFVINTSLSIKMVGVVMKAILLNKFNDTGEHLLLKMDYDQIYECKMLSVMLYTYIQLNTRIL